MDMADLRLKTQEAYQQQMEPAGQPQLAAAALASAQCTLPALEEQIEAWVKDKADAENQGESKERNGGTGREGHNGKAQRPDQVTKDTELMGLRWAWVWM